MDHEAYKQFYAKEASSNKEYQGELDSITFVLKQGIREKKIFKWIFKKGDVDFYIAFPYFDSSAYYCGVIKFPKGVARIERFDAVVNGIPSTTPVKFSYHKDGNVHFKPTEEQLSGYGKAYTLARITVPPLADLNGDHIFSITFEGLERFQDLKKHRSKAGLEEVVLPVSEDIKSYKILAYAGSTEESLQNKVSGSATPWFIVKGETTECEPVFIGVYAILNKQSHILDDKKEGLTVLVGFDPATSSIENDFECLYLFAR